MPSDAPPPAESVTEGKPVPLPDEITAPFWEATRQGRLHIQHCGACGFYIHAPRIMCPRCGNERLEVRPVSGRGVLYGFTVIRESATRGFEPPYVAAYIELAEQPGLIYLANIVEADPASLRLGMPLKAVYETIAPGWALPQFRPAGDA